MDIKSAAQVIRDTVSMDEILGLYGYRPKRGFMACPFHGDKDPSLKVYSGLGGHSGWHCFGCGRGGSVIDFVQDHEDCDFRTAVHAIDNACRLNLFPKNENPYDAEDRARIQKWLDSFVTAVNEYCDARIFRIEAEQKTRLDMVRILEDKAEKDKQSVTADEWTAIAGWKDEDEYSEYQKARIEEFKEEVAAWRRKARGVRSA